MADKSIDQLIAAESILPTDLFVLQQSSMAKKLPGQVLLNWLTAAADGHGGIRSIEKLSTNVLVDTYRITLADTTTFDFVVNNGRGISSIVKTSTSGLTDTYTINYTDNTSATFNVNNGAKGDKGDNTYLWIKYASVEPTAASHSFGNLPDDWIGIYFGPLDTAPSDWTAYAWYKIKGEKGDTGAPATLVSSTISYQVSEYGTIVPSGSWSDSVPSVPQGKYLWTRTVHQFNTGNPVAIYSVSRMGIDGTGSVSAVAGVAPDTSGNVPLTAADLNAVTETRVVELINTATAAQRALQFHNVSVAASAFLADITYTEYPYRAKVTLTGVDATMIPEVVLSVADAIGGNFAPVAETTSGGLYVYAKAVPTEQSVLIPTIICWRGNV